MMATVLILSTSFPFLEHHGALAKALPHCPRPHTPCTAGTRRCACHAQTRCLFRTSPFPCRTSGTSSPASLLHRGQRSEGLLYFPQLRRGSVSKSASGFQ